MLRSSHSLWQSLDEGSLGCEPGPHYISLAWGYPYWSCALEMTENIGVPLTSFRPGRRGD
ncbi:unnamed protein product [Eretmochelys imbricata]